MSDAKHSPASEETSPRCRERTSEFAIQFRPVHWAALAALGILYSIYVIAQWSLAYIDFGDGNYMYISRRIAEGAVVYRDILAPQPPCHLYLGALIWRIAWLLRLPEPIYAFRAFSLLLHLSTAAMLVRLAWKMWASAATAVVAGAIFLWLPLGHWWSLGYQSEPLETFFLVAMVLFGLRSTPKTDLVAGVFAGLATLTNATAWPFLCVLFLFFLIESPRRLPRFLLPWLTVAGLVTIALQIRTGGAFLNNVVFNQAGTFPPDAIAYGFGKLVGQGQEILVKEGMFLCLALIALARLIRESPLPRIERGALAWYLMSTLGAIVYVTKGGTEDYIFSLAEPAIAVLAAGELASWARRWSHGDFRRPALHWIAGLTLLLFANLHAVIFQWTLWHKGPPIELRQPETDRLVHLIEHESKPGDRILAPPFYAVRAGRTLWQDYSELFIWFIKFKTDREENRTAGEGWSKIKAMADAIDKRELPLVILEMGQTGRTAEPMLALMKNYRPLKSNWLGQPGEQDHYLFFTQNTRLGIFVAAPANETPAQAATRKVEWDGFKQELVDVFGVSAYSIFGLWYSR